MLAVTLRHRSGDFKEAAVKAIGVLGDRRGLELLRPLLYDWRYYRPTVAAALKALGEPALPASTSLEGFDFDDLDDLEEIG